MKHKLSILAATLLLGGCGSTLDITASPATIAKTEGIEAAVEWCHEREIVKAEAGILAHLGAAVIDLPLNVITAPVQVVAGPVLQGTTHIRDEQCATLLQ